MTELSQSLSSCSFPPNLKFNSKTDAAKIEKRIIMPLETVLVLQVAEKQNNDTIEMYRIITNRIRNNRVHKNASNEKEIIIYDLFWCYGYILCYKLEK